MFKHIMVPTDESELSEKTVAKAIAFAKELRAQITFLCVVQQTMPFYYGVGEIFDSHVAIRLKEELNAFYNTVLDKALAETTREEVEAKRKILISDSPYEAILEAVKTEGCDLIFMASHGRRGVEHFLLGSETYKVLSHSTIPVLVDRY